MNLLSSGPAAITFIVYLVALAHGPEALASERPPHPELTLLEGDVKLACEARLCLAAPNRPRECDPAMRRLMSIKKRRPYATLRAREKFLELCPVGKKSTGLETDGEKGVTMDFPALARDCAPQVHTETIAALVRHESSFDPLVINVNSRPPRIIRPKTHRHAVQEARRLIEQGVNFDAGLGQINVRNWNWLGLRPETAFDPCTNLASAQRVLLACHERATSALGSGQRALHATLSCYNTGGLQAGFTNGYVAKVIANADRTVPALQTGLKSTLRLDSQRSLAGPRTEPKQATSSMPAKGDAFSVPRADAFGRTPATLAETPLARSAIFRAH